MTSRICLKLAKQFELISFYIRVCFSMIFVALCNLERTLMLLLLTVSLDTSLIGVVERKLGFVSAQLLLDVHLFSWLESCCVATVC